MQGGRKSVEVARAGRQLGTRLERLALTYKLDWNCSGWAGRVSWWEVNQARDKDLA